jgi:hypothetical protein
MLPCLALQRAAAQKAEAPVMSKRGQDFCLAHMTKAGTWEYKMAEAIPALEHLGPALQQMVGSAKPPTAVVIKTMLAVPRYTGVVDIVRSHAAFTDRKSNCLVPDNVAYQGYEIDQGGNMVHGTWYGQLLAQGTIAGTQVDFCFVRDYSMKGTGRRFPLTLRPLSWAEPKRTKRSRATTVAGCYTAISPSMLQHEVCIVPNYAKDPEQNSAKGHFLLIDLVHLAPQDLQAWEMADAESTDWIWDRPTVSA